MKRFLIMFILFFLVICISSCTKYQKSNQEIMDIFSYVSLDLTYVLAYETFEDGRSDYNESMHVKDLSGVYIEIQMNHRLLFTPSYIYQVQNMSKITHNHQITSLKDYQYLMTHFVVLIDFDFLSKETFNDLLKTCALPIMYSSTRISHEIKCVFPKANASDDFHQVLHIIFDDTHIQSVHMQFEADFTSTKQQSNYLYGKHFDFSFPFSIPFPNILDFKG